MINKFNKELIVPYIILFIVLVFSVYPLLYMISTSLMTAGEAANQYLFPKKLIFENYLEVWTSNNFQKYTINSIVFGFYGKMRFCINLCLIILGTKITINLTLLKIGMYFYVYALRYVFMF